MAGLAQLKCPDCGFIAPITVFAGEKEAMQVAALMGRVPPVLSATVFRYVGLFAPAKHGLTFAKMRKVLEALVPAIEAGRITFAKREMAISLQQFEDGMQQLCNKRAQLDLPLANHNYLFKVLMGFVEKVEAKAEAEGIERLRNGGSREDGEAQPIAGTAGEWDQQRVEANQRLRALQAATTEVKSYQRLKLAPLTQAELESLLVKQGFSAAFATFAATKALAASIPSPTEGA